MIKAADYLDCILEKPCERSPYLALVFKSFDLISISNIYQNFYISRSDMKKNQNSKPIYCRSENPNSETKIQNPEQRTQNLELNFETQMSDPSI